MIVKLLLAAWASAPSVAVRVYVPAVLTLQPANVATPATAVRGLVVQLTLVPPPVTARVTALVSPVTVLPYVSWTVTTGWAANAVPATVDAEGCVVNATLAAAAAVIVKLLLAAWASAPSVAVRVYVPAVLTLQPANVATPATAVRGLVVQLTLVPPPVTARVTALVSPVTVLPYVSWTVTTGWAANAVPATVDAEGCVVNATLAAAAAVIVSGADVPDRVVGLSVTVSVVVSASTSVTGIVATPALKVTLLPVPQLPAAG